MIAPPFIDKLNPGIGSGSISKRGNTMESQNGINWKAVLWAAVLMFVLPMIVIFLIPTIYGTYIGFSTRGDMNQVNAGVQSLGSSLAYQVAVYVIFALVALWRGYVLAKKVPGQFLMHLGIAVLFTTILVAAYFVLGSGNITAVWDVILIILLMIAAGGYLGSLFKTSQAATT